MDFAVAVAVAIVPHRKKRCVLPSQFGFPPPPLPPSKVNRVQVASHLLADKLHYGAVAIGRVEEHINQYERNRINRCHVFQLSLEGGSGACQR